MNRPQPGLDSRTERSWATLAVVVLLAAGGALAWSNSFRVPFVFDDEGSITGNARLHRLWPVWKSVWAPPDTTLAGRPVAAFTFAVNWAIHGPDVRGYHAVNLAVHVLAALALFGLVRRTLRLPSLRERFGPAATAVALAAALLWMLHPLHTQSVTYIVRRVEAMMGLFFLLTLYAAARAFESPSRGWRAAGVSFCALGMATSETMAVAPVVVLLYDRAFVSGSFGDALRRRRGFYACLAATWVIVLAIQLSGPRGSGAGIQLPSAATTSYLRLQGHFILRYLAHVFWPHGLVFDYGMLASQSGRGGAAETALVLALAGAAAAVTAWRPRWGFLPATFFLTLAPSSSVIPILPEVAADNRMYLPLAAIVAGVVTGLYALGRRAFGRWAWEGALVGAFAAAGVAALLGYLTYARNRDYESAMTLWQDVVTKCPDNPRAHGNLGVQLSHARRYADAESHYLRAIELDGRYPDAQFNLARLLAVTGRPAEAAERYRALLGWAPGHHKALNNLAWLLATYPDASLRSGPEAVRLAEEACRLTGYAEPGALDTLAAAYAETGRWEDAVLTAQKAVDAAARSGQNDVLNALREHLALFERRQPYREVPKP